MATRRDALAAVIGDSLDSVAGGDSGGTEAVRPESEAGFPFELLSGSDLAAEPDPVPTRVKSSKDKPAESKTPPKVPRGTASERQLAEIGESLEEKVVQASFLLAGLAPVTSAYAAENSPKAINALLSIAKRRPAVLKYLSKAADGVDALEIAKFIGGLVVAIQVDTQRLRGDELPAQAFGVTAILEEHFWNQDEQPYNPGMEFQVPRYVAV